MCVIGTVGCQRLLLVPRAVKEAGRAGYCRPERKCT